VLIIEYAFVGRGEIVGFAVSSNRAVLAEVEDLASWAEEALYLEFVGAIIASA
jgi:hypothetical protein